MPPALLALPGHSMTWQGRVTWSSTLGKDPPWTQPHRDLALQPPNLPANPSTQARPSPGTHRDTAPSPRTFPTFPVQGAQARAKAHPGRVWAENHQSTASQTHFLHSSHSFTSIPFATSSSRAGWPVKRPQNTLFYSENRSKTMPTPSSSQTAPGFCCLEENSPL